MNAKTCEICGSYVRCRHKREIERYQTTPQGLIRQFERDILYDAHALLTRVRRSDAGKDLVSRGREVIGIIAAYLAAGKPYEMKTFDSDLRRAWGMLLAEFEQKIDPMRSAPQFYDHFPGWIAWAERMAGDQMAKTP